MGIKKSLTQSFANKVEYKGNGKSSEYYYDTKVHNFWLRVYPSGKKSYMIHVKNKNNKWIKIIIGSALSITLEDARNAAKKLFGQAVIGKDIQAIHNIKYYTVSEVADLFIKDYIPIHRLKTSVKATRYVHKHLKNGPFSNMAINNINQTHIANYHVKLAKNTPIVANRVLSIISAFFNYAKSSGKTPKDFVNPALNVKKAPENKIETFLKYEDAKKIIKAADQIVVNEKQHHRIPYLLRMYLCTGARNNEVLKLKWSDIDYTAKTVKFSDTKNGKDHIIRPPEQIWKVIDELKKYQELSSLYLFPGKSGKAPMSNFQKVWTQIRKEANIKHVTIHDLRRTVATWMRTEGASNYQIAAALNQSLTGGVVDRYAKSTGQDSENAFKKLGEVIKRYNII